MTGNIKLKEFDHGNAACITIPIEGTGRLHGIRITDEEVVRLICDGVEYLKSKLDGYIKFSPIGKTTSENWKPAEEKPEPGYYPVIRATPNGNTLQDFDIFDGNRWGDDGLLCGNVTHWFNIPWPECDDKAVFLRRRSV